MAGLYKGDSIMKRTLLVAVLAALVALPLLARGQEIATAPQQTPVPTCSIVRGDVPGTTYVRVIYLIEWQDFKGGAMFFAKEADVFSLHDGKGRGTLLGFRPVPGWNTVTVRDSGGADVAVCQDKFFVGDSTTKTFPTAPPSRWGKK